MQTVHPLLYCGHFGLSSQDKGGQHSHQWLDWHAVFSKNSPDTLWFVVGRQSGLNASASNTKLCSDGMNDCRLCLPKRHLCLAVAAQGNELVHICTDLGRPLLHKLQVPLLWIHPALFPLWTPNPKRCRPRLKNTINTLRKYKYEGETAIFQINCRCENDYVHTPWILNMLHSDHGTLWQVLLTMHTFLKAIIILISRIKSAS